MHIDIEIFNSVAAIATALTVFLLGGLIIASKKK